MRAHESFNFEINFHIILSEATIFRGGYCIVTIGDYFLKKRLFFIVL